MSETPVIEDQVEKVRLVGEGVTVVPDDGRETAEVESELDPPTTSGQLCTSGEYTGGSYFCSCFNRGPRAKAGMTVGIPKTRPEKVSLPLRHCRHAMPFKTTSDSFRMDP